MWQDLKKSINFTRGQRKTIFYFSLIILLLLLIRIFMPGNSRDFSLDTRLAAQIDSLEKANRPEPQKTQNQKDTPKKPKRQWNPKPFDPNLLPEKEWLNFGLSPRQARTIANYLAAGGKFRKKEDLKKIYCISNRDYRRIKKYIVITEEIKPENPREEHDSSARQPLPETEKPVLLELNTCNREQLMSIRGIGPAVSKGIVSYRKILGGYYSVNQLLEVYTIDSARWLAIKDHFTVNPDSIHKMNLNKAGFYTLKRHPYISERLALEISEHARHEQRFQSVKDLKLLPSVNDSIYQKISPYFMAQ